MISLPNGAASKSSFNRLELRNGIMTICRSGVRSQQPLPSSALSNDFDALKASSKNYDFESLTAADDDADAAADADAAYGRNFEEISLRKSFELKRWRPFLNNTTTFF